MCYVIEEMQKDGNLKGVCWFHDKESAQEILDYLEMQNFDKEFELLTVPLAYTREYGTPYCKEYLECVGFLSAKKGN